MEREVSGDKSNYNDTYEKEKVRMDWIERLNKAVNYIEENITEEIDYTQAAKIACCSTYHFQRMFAYMAGTPLSEYIRCRRMTLAAADLQDAGHFRTYMVSRLPPRKRKVHLLSRFRL